MLGKVLVLGSGGREHALVKACLSSPKVGSIIAAPGNGGMAQEIDCRPLDLTNVSATVDLAQAEAVDFVIVGPEMPLALGVIDALTESGILAYGPNRAAAQLEASKPFAKGFLSRHSIPTGHYAVFTEKTAALAYLQNQPLPVVIKAAGLAGGKGVFIAHTPSEARQAITDLLKTHGETPQGDEMNSNGGESSPNPAGTIVIEEYLEGEEASIHAIVCGTQYVLLPSSQDHKRIGEGDTGPNTGGMGAYAPADVVTPALSQEIMTTILEPTLTGLAAEGIHYQGTLYIGLMLTNQGPKVLEFNVRFGDPETHVLLPLLDIDVVPLLHDCAVGKLSTHTLPIKPHYAIVVVLAAKGYPGTYPKGEILTLPTNISDKQRVIHAGTRIDPLGRIVTHGGRVLGITALGPTLQDAADSAYTLCQQSLFHSQYYRRDIGYRQLQRSH